MTVTGTAEMSGGGNTATLKASGTETATPLPTPTGTSTPTATIAHVMVPGEPGAVEWYATDYSSQGTAAQKRAPGGDSFQYNLFERPFLSAEMKYLPGIDIVRADIAKDSNWFFVTIRLQAAPTAEEKQSAKYGVEVDADLDGRGDYLMWASAPAGTTWTTDGVQIWQDENNDVGGSIPVRAETPGTWNGYENLMFDQGQGADPDAAWARFSPANANYIQIAFKRAAIGNDLQFLWAAWADGGIKQPGWFDYNDHFTSAESGSPLSAQAEYPLKALAAVDNTCRMAYGFTLLGTEPGACYVAGPTKTPTLMPTTTATTTKSGGFQKIFHVTSAEVNRVETIRKPGDCHFYTTAYGRITANPSGDAVYRWEYSINHGSFIAMPSLTIHFAGPGTQGAGYIARDSLAAETLTFRIHVTAPNEVYSPEVSAVITCP